MILNIPVEANASPLPEPEGCLHNEHLESKVAINYLDDLHRYTADVSVRCEKCGVMFLFDALPVGVLITKPCVSAFGTSVSLPITPGPIDPDWKPQA